MNLKELEKELCFYFNIDGNLLRSKSRKQVIVDKRYIFFCFAYWYIYVNIESITGYLNMHHANIYSAIDECENEHTLKPKYDMFVEYISKIYKIDKVNRDNRRKPYKYKERPLTKRHNCMVDMHYVKCGSFIKSFRTAKEAAEHLNVKRGKIYHSCNKGSHIGIYKFRYQ
jgi:hypothetical protein